MQIAEFNIRVRGTQVGFFHCGALARVLAAQRECGCRDRDGLICRLYIIHCCITSVPGECSCVRGHTHTHTHSVCISSARTRPWRKQKAVGEVGVAGRQYPPTSHARVFLFPAVFSPAKWISRLETQPTDHRRH